LIPINNKHVILLKNSINLFEQKYQSFDNNQIIHEVNKILMYPGFILYPNGAFAVYDDHTPTKNTIFCRARILNDDSIINDIKQYWNLIPEKVLNIGRLNLENESVLYTTHGSNITALNEIGARVDDKVILISYKRIPGVRILCKNMTILNQQLHNKENPLSKLTNLKYKFINDWIKKNDKGNEKLYFVTNAIKNHYFNGNDKIECCGMIYPSLLGTDKHNLIFLDDKVKANLYIDNIIYGKILEINHNSFKLIQEYKFIEVHNDKVVWEKISKPEILLSFI